MGHIERSIRAISPVLAVLMMIAVAIAGSLVVYAWIMGYIDLSTERSGEAIAIQNVFNDGADMLVYVHNIGEGVAQLDEDECLYVNGILVSCTISGVTVSDDLATLAQGETATLRYVGGAALPGEKVKIKVTTLHGTPAEKHAYPAGTAGLPPGTTLWNLTCGGEGAKSVVVTSDGGYILAGDIVLVDSFSVNTDAWLVKTDAFGNVEWNRTYGGTESDEANSVVETSDGGYAFAGYTFSYGVGQSDCWLVKIDSSGNVEWNRTYGGTQVDFDSAASLIVTSDGGYAIAGRTETFGAGNDDFWLIKTDALGNAEWNQTYGGPESDEATCVVETSDGGYAIAGTTTPIAGTHYFWLIKTDSLGNAEWNRTYGELGGDRAYSLIATSDGGYAMAGETMSATINVDCWLIKTDASGTVQWNQTYGGSETDKAYSVIATSDGGYALAGTTESFGAGNSDFWLIKTDASGNMEWNQAYGVPQSDYAYSLVETSDGGYAIAGSTHGDFWLVKTT